MSQADPAKRSSRMEVLLVRSVEKALDAVNGLLKPTSWNAVLSKDDGLRVLQVSPQASHHCPHCCSPAHDELGTCRGITITSCKVLC